MLVKNDIGVVYGGGNVGLMGVLADEMVQLGGKITGVIPEKLQARELGHGTITELIVVETMHQRKAKMAEMADAFVALPGGIGTLEEIVEVFTWLQLGYHHKQCALLDADGFYTGLIQFLNHTVQEGFLDQSTLENLIIEKEPEVLIGKLIN